MQTSEQQEIYDSKNDVDLAVPLCYIRKSPVKKGLNPLHGKGAMQAVVKQPKNTHVNSIHSCNLAGFNFDFGQIMLN
jgi:hypothetical protein